MENETSTNIHKSSISWQDWTVIGIMVIVSVAIGIYYRYTGTRQKTASDYFLANRSVGNIMLSFSMMVVYISASSLLGLSAENYSYGVEFNVIYIGFFIGTPIISYFYLPVFYKLKIMTVYEYLQQRFGISTKFIASTCCFLLITLYTGLTIYGPALALEAITTFDSTTSILLIGFVCTFYSCIGGIKAVITTDIVQSVLMLICVCSVIGVALSEIDGGIWNVFETAKAGGRFNLNFDFDPTIRHTWWSLTIGGTVLFISTFGCGQVEVQRMSSAKTIGDARRALFICIPMFLMMVFIISFSGLVLYTYYVHCDPVTAGKIKSYDMLMPYFVKDRMSRIPGLTGIVIAGIFSASLSTASAMLNSLAAIALADYIKPLYHRLGIELPGDKSIFYGRILCAGMGCVTLSLAFLASTWGSLIQVGLTIHGSIGGPILGLFTLGMFTESANEIGANIGLIIAMIVSFILALAPKTHTPKLSMSIDTCPNSTYLHQHHLKKISDPSTYFFINRLSYLWTPVIGMMTSIIIGYLVSLIIRKYSKTPQSLLDINLFTPLLGSRIKCQREKETKNKQIFVLNIKKFDEND